MNNKINQLVDIIQYFKETNKERRNKQTNKERVMKVQEVN